MKWTVLSPCPLLVHHQRAHSIIRKMGTWPGHVLFCVAVCMLSSERLSRRTYGHTDCLDLPKTRTNVWAISNHPCHHIRPWTKHPTKLLRLRRQRSDLYYWTKSAEKGCC